MLLQQIVASIPKAKEKVEFFWEASSKITFSRLYTVHGDSHVQLQRKNLLERLSNNYTSHFHDLDHDTKMYQNDSMRESHICSKIREKVLKSKKKSIIILLIGIDHCLEIQKELSNTFSDIELHFPNMNILPYHPKRDLNNFLLFNARVFSYQVPKLEKTNFNQNTGFFSKKQKRATTIETVDIKNICDELTSVFNSRMHYLNCSR